MHYLRFFIFFLSLFIYSKVIAFYHSIEKLNITSLDPFTLKLNKKIIDGLLSNFKNNTPLQKIAQQAEQYDSSTLRKILYFIDSLELRNAKGPSNKIKYQQKMIMLQYFNALKYRSKKNNSLPDKKLRTIVRYKHAVDNDPTQLDLRYLQITNKKLDSYVSNAKEKENIQILSLAHNCLTFLDIPALLKAFPNLLIINASYNLLRDVVVDEKIPLLSLNLSHNCLTFSPKIGEHILLNFTHNHSRLSLPKVPTALSEEVPNPRVALPTFFKLLKARLPEKENLRNLKKLFFFKENIRFLRNVNMKLLLLYYLSKIACPCLHHSYPLFISSIINGEKSCSQLFKKFALVYFITKIIRPYGIKI